MRENEEWKKEKEIKINKREEQKLKNRLTTKNEGRKWKVMREKTKKTKQTKQSNSNHRHKIEEEKLKFTLKT